MPVVYAATVQGSDLTLDFLDVIGRDFWGEGITAKNVARTLKENSKAKRIVVRLNSPGGSTTEGTAIYNLLRSDGRDVHVQVIGLAASMASVIMLAGDTVEIADNALVMIHNPWMLTMGGSQELRKNADLLDKIKATLLNVYEGRTNLDRDELDKMMSAETWMGATEAIKHGFADSLMHAVDEPEDKTEGRAAAVLSRFTYVPSQLLARMGKAAAVATTTSTKGKKTMERDKIIAALGLPADASDDDIMRAMAGTRASVDLSTHVPRADYDALKAKVAEAEAKARAEAEAAKAEAERAFKASVETAIDGAVASGKIPPSSKEYHRTTCLAGGAAALEAFNSYVKDAPVIASNEQTTRARAYQASTGGTSVSPDERLVAKLIGVSVEDLAKARADIRENPDVYPPEVYAYAL